MSAVSSWVTVTVDAHRALSFGQGPPAPLPLGCAQPIWAAGEKSELGGGGRKEVLSSRTLTATINLSQVQGQEGSS